MVSGKALKSKEFLSALPNLSLRHKGRVQQLIMNRPGISRLAGVVRQNNINFLANFFQKRLQHRTTNSPRSALSVYHKRIDGNPVGKHPRACALLSGVFSRRLPNQDILLLFVMQKDNHHHLLIILSLNSQNYVLQNTLEEYLERSVLEHKRPDTTFTEYS